MRRRTARWATPSRRRPTATSVAGALRHAPATRHRGRCGDHRPAARLSRRRACDGRRAGRRREIVTRYLLADHNGRTVSDQDFRGRFQLITFGYTYCPDVCPTTLAEMAAVMKNL